MLHFYQPVKITEPTKLLLVGIFRSPQAVASTFLAPPSERGPLQDFQGHERYVGARGDLCTQRGFRGVELEFLQGESISNLGKVCGKMPIQFMSKFVDVTITPDLDSLMRKDAIKY